MKLNQTGTHRGIEWGIADAPIYGAVNGYVRLPEDHPWLADTDNVPAHGRITYGPDRDRWIGFDTLHAGDKWPDSPDHGYVAKEWTRDLVIEETKRLAARAADVLDERGEEREVAARHVLHHCGHPGGYEAGTFTTNLINTFERADAQNWALLASVFPVYAQALQIMRDEGAGALRDWAGIR